MLDLILSTVAQGLLWSLLAIGVFITFRVLDIADLTVEGSFPLGAAVCAVLLVKGYNPEFAMLMALLAGMLAGVVTGLLTTKLKIPALLAGILSMIALYSVNLRIMEKANIPLLGVETIYDQLDWISDETVMVTLAVAIGVVFLVGLFLYYFFGTEIGVAIRATGANIRMIRAQGVNTDTMIVLGLLLSNGFVALSGALIAQSNGYADIGMGVGTIVIGLASVIIGEVLFGTRSFGNCLLSVLLGSVIYRAVIAIVLYLGMPPNDLKLFTAIIVAIALSLPLLKQQWQER